MKLKIYIYTFCIIPNLVFADITDNFRWSIDSSARYNDYSEPNKSSQIYFIGLDTHKVFSNNNGDFAYSVMQFYYTKLSNQNPYPFMFDSPNDGKIIVREAHVNYTPSHFLIPNIRIGHFTLPFGLEDSNDTNGRLLDYGHGSTLGTKLDWGILLNKVHDKFEYKVSYTLGGKNDPKSVDGSYLYTGRFSTLSHQDYIFGLSFYFGELDNNERQRVSFDLQYYYQTWGVKAELAQGQFNDDDQRYALIELNKQSIDDSKKIYGQYIYKDSDSFEEAQSLALVGFSYQLNTQLEASIEFKKQLVQVNDGKSSIFRAQIRYRY
ncbi:hypothetical protein KO527_14215 [Pseudoalteromonas sp. C2R02]|uniref:hypothetical protein n=1 Tax=Pseudoalteromonas sp. C2R02 TaxID=2841565 RepID=UPI001C08C17A|nr:hypothetical protein [Pseudoalteromonas sp. C2R02]MBU2970505.1 hypothetical protein [Pseudoalteromonas sp. C2R02]